MVDTTTEDPRFQPAFPTITTQSISISDNGDVYVAAFGDYNTYGPILTPQDLQTDQTYSVIYKLDKNLNPDTNFGLPLTTDLTPETPSTRYIFINQFGYTNPAPELSNLQVKKIIVLNDDKILALFSGTGDGTDFPTNAIVLARFAANGRGTDDVLTGLDHTFTDVNLLAAPTLGFSAVLEGAPRDMVVTSNYIYVGGFRGTDYLLARYTYDGQYEAEVTGTLPDGNGSGSVITSMLVNQDIIYVSGTTLDAFGSQVSIDSFNAPALTLNADFTGSALGVVTSGPGYSNSRIIRQSSGNLLIASYRSLGADNENVYVFGRLANGFENTDFAEDGELVFSFSSTDYIQSINLDLAANDGFIVSGKVEISTNPAPNLQYFVLSYNQSGTTQASQIRGYNPQNNSLAEISDATSRQGIVENIDASGYLNGRYYLGGELDMATRIYLSLIHI